MMEDKVRDNYFRGLVFALVLFLLPTGLTGCTSTEAVDITRRSIIVAIGLDKLEDDNLELTLQVVNPGGLGISEEDGAVNIEPMWIKSTKGKTIFEATRSQLGAISRRPYYNHVQVLVICDELAREGIRDMLDFFARDSQARLSPKVIIAKGVKARDVVGAKSIMETIPAMHLNNILSNNEVNGFIPNLTIFDILKALTTDTYSIVVGSIEPTEEGGQVKIIKDISVKHVAVFNGDRLVGWLNKLEAKGLAYVKNQVRSMEIGVKDPFNRDNELLIEQRNSTRKIEMEFENKKPRALITIKGKGSIIEEFGDTDLMAEDKLEKIEKAVEETIKEDIEKVIYKAQKEFNSDILGLGDFAYKRHFKYWEEVRDQWQEIFCSMPIQVDVDFKIERTGLIGPPSSPNKSSIK